MTLSRHSKYMILSWLVLAALAVVMLVPSFASAQTIDPNKLRIGIITRAYNSDSVGALIFSLVQIVLLLGGVIAFFYVLYGGFMYLTAGPDPANADKGRKTIFNALIGIIIISVSYALVTFVVSKTRDLESNTNSTGTTGTGGTR